MKNGNIRGNGETIKAVFTSLEQHHLANTISGDVSYMAITSQE